MFERDLDVAQVTFLFWKSRKYILTFKLNEENSEELFWFPCVPISSLLIP